jgi:SAM-dependent methyltransferase
MTQWFENDAFWEEFGPMMFDARRVERTPAELGWILETTGVAAPGPALDLCCGNGRASHELARRGFDVTGVDRYEPYLEQARAAGLDRIEWVNEDMRRFVRDCHYALALSLYTSWGYFDDRNEDTQVLRNVFASLKPGGRFVLEIKGKEPLARVFQPRIFERLEDGTIFLHEGEIGGAWEFCNTKWTLIHPDGTQTTGGHRTRLYSGTELDALLRSVGFTEVAFFGDLAGAPFDHTAKRLVAVATR